MEIGEYLHWKTDLAAFQKSLSYCYDLCICYLLTHVQLHDLSIAANAVEETQAETFPTHGIFVQLACTPIYRRTPHNANRVNCNHWNNSSFKRWMAPSCADWFTWNSVLMGEAGAVKDAGLWLDQIRAGRVSWWRWESEDLSGPVSGCFVVTRLHNKIIIIIIIFWLEQAVSKHLVSARRLKRHHTRLQNQFGCLKFQWRLHSSISSFFTSAITAASVSGPPLWPWISSSILTSLTFKPQTVFFLLWGYFSSSTAGQSEQRVSLPRLSYPFVCERLRFFMSY